MFRMANICFVVATLVVLTSASSTSDASENGLSAQAMEQVFARSEKVHEEHMAAITATMSVQKASEVLQQQSISTPALLQATNMALSGSGQLRKQPKGYSGSFLFR